ncbi:hypothetical protein F5887DRAFT_974995 [Amanita rubescens]|nr:hypothetical protein F5887DRAFT_999720 [Amanita rubescens]KAF8342390.1 hypothetical protein F5887DRAFT_974995 [Amanita rubescens]
MSITSYPRLTNDRSLKEFDPSDFSFGRSVVPVPNKNKLPRKDKLGFEYAEHCFIGDAITLTLAKDQKVAASDYPLPVGSNLNLTYGQIDGLAGDFYGTYEPISDGKDAQEQSTRFVSAWNSLANGGPRLPQEALDILSVLQTEVNAVNNALEHHQDPSIAYSELPDMTWKFEQLTFGRTDIPGYLGLASINWDHFGRDAHTVYNAGHATALQKAVHGDLKGAYAMNAFADHFLEDSFSAGHLRTPRRHLHSKDRTADICAKYMHDEDNAIGLNVTNPNGDKWMAYGDKRALDEVDKKNLDLCVQAVQASADEIYKAFSTRIAPKSSNYAAWNYAPTLLSAAGPQALAPLFELIKGELERRRVITHRRIWDFTTDYWFWATALECKLSGLWNYPITLQLPPSK